MFSKHAEAQVTRLLHPPNPLHEGIPETSRLTIVVAGRLQRHHRLHGICDEGRSMIVAACNRDPSTYQMIMDMRRRDVIAADVPT